MENLKNNINPPTPKESPEEEIGSVIINNSPKSIIENNCAQNEEQLIKMINLYGIDGLSFDYKSNPDKTIKAEETKMVEQRKNNKGNIQSNIINKIDELINDPSINNLTKVQLKSKILTIEEEMKNEIQLIKEKYEKKLKKYKISLNFLKENQFLKNLKEYKEYQKFTNKIKLQVDFIKGDKNKNKSKYQDKNINININNNINFNEFNNNFNNIEIKNYNAYQDINNDIPPELMHKNMKTKPDICSSGSLIAPSTTSVKPNHVLVFNYKPNNISIKKNLVFD